jgi:hypothetical protein
MQVDHEQASQTQFKLQSITCRNETGVYALETLNTLMEEGQLTEADVNALQRLTLRAQVLYQSPTPAPTPAAKSPPSSPPKIKRRTLMGGDRFNPSPNLVASP